MQEEGSSPLGPEGGQGFTGGWGGEENSREVCASVPLQVGSGGDMGKGF